jgi:hypothetical protein
MLNFVSFHLAIKYFLLSFIAVVGVLQLMATSQKLVGLSLGGRVSALGIPLGVSLVLGAFVWFFSTTPEVFSPGLAGAELSLLFGAGGLCALMFTLGMSSFVLEMRERGERRGRREKEKGERVAFQQLRGALYIPGDRPFPLPAICVVPSPSEGEAPLLPLIRRIVGGGFIVLVVDWSEPRYPDVLALLPTAIAYLLRREEVDPKRIGALGVDLGGDLVIRAASTDGRIKSVLAVAPYLCEANTKPGLSILKEMSYWQALLWSRSTNREKLVMELAAISSMEKLEGRPLLLVYGEEDGITSAEVAISSGRTKLLPGEGHLSIPRSQKLASLAVQWFNETLESE